jgi:hypothetical protein
MAMSSLTYILGFSVRFFQPVYSVYEYYKSFERKISQKNPEYMLNYVAAVKI